MKNLNICYLTTWLRHLISYELTFGIWYHIIGRILYFIGSYLSDELIGANHMSERMLYVITSYLSDDLVGAFDIVCCILWHRTCLTTWLGHLILYAIFYWIIPVWWFGWGIWYYMLYFMPSYLSDDLVGAFDEDLQGPPVILSHVLQKPLRRRQTSYHSSTWSAGKNTA